MPDIAEPELKEAEVVTILCNSSKKFREFYENERVKRAGDIHWIRNPSLSKEIEALECTNPDTGRHEIHLRKFPVPTGSAHLIAHEIVHTILAEEDKSLTIMESNPKYSKLRWYIETLLEDPIVNLYLQEVYHFNSSSSCNNLEFIKQAWENQDEPEDYLSRVAIALLLAVQMLEWRLVKDQYMLQNWSDYLEWYSSRLPNIYLMGVGLISITQRVGLETLEMRKMAFSEIVKQYQLQKYICLKE